MLWFLFFALLVSIFSSTELLRFLAPLSSDLQKKCAALISKDLTHRELAASFVCGTSLKDPNFYFAFQKTSLLHLMVVSGSHLQFLSMAVVFFLSFLTPKSRIAKSLLWFALLFYCLVTGFQPPVVRAFTSRIVAFLSRRASWNWDGGKIQISSGLFVLMIFPQWILSFSFYLSWLASLGFLLEPLCQYYEKPSRWLRLGLHALTSALVQILMGVCFLQISFLGIITNALLAPLIAFTLLPLSLLPTLFPAVSVVADRAWDFLLALLNWLLDFFPQSAPQPIFPISSLRWIALWTFLAFIHCSFEALRRYRYQESHV